MNCSLQVLRLNEIETLTNDISFKTVVDANLNTKLLNELQERKQSIYSYVCGVTAEQSALSIMYVSNVF